MTQLTCFVGFVIQGAPEEIIIPVVVLGAQPFIMDGLTMESFDVQITNPLATVLTLENFQTEVLGNAAAKISVAVLDAIMTISPGMTSTNKITIETNEVLLPDETLTLSMTCEYGD